MIEPIRYDEQRTTLYERYALYKQYQKTANADVSQMQRPVAAPQSQSTPTGVSGQPESLLQNAVSAPSAAGGQVPSVAGKGNPGSPEVLGINQPDASGQSYGFPEKTPDTANTGRLMSVAARECQTCKNRAYQDQSDDPGVSMQTPTKISPEKAGAAVKAHENEHVTREQAKAKRENREVVSQSVILKTAICPECGKVYISGGTTTTVTRAVNEDNKFAAREPSEGSGLFLDKKI